MLQTNLIFGIQSKIKAGHQSAEAAPVEEKEEILLENYYNPGIVAGIHQQAEKSKKSKKHRKNLVTEAFHIKKAQKKLNSDIAYFNYLYENFVDDIFKKDYETLLESIFEDTIRLYQECDVTPRLISPALDSNELNENQIVELYRNNLNESVKNNYTKPLLSGKINELYENEIRTLTKKLLEENVSANTDQIRIYLPFEETIYRFNREVLIPKTAESRMESFMESMSADYMDLLEETAEDIMRGIEKKIKLLTSMISPNMFSKVVDADGVDAPKMAGISITVDKNFDDLDPEDCDGPCSEDPLIDPEVAEEMADEEEALELDDADDASEDIVGAEEDARDQTDLANDTEDLEGQDAEDKAELSPAEAADEDAQPGAVEMELSSEAGETDDTNHATNTSDIELQGDGNANGIGKESEDATLPGEATSADSVEADDGDGSAEEVNTETPSEEQMDKIEKDKDEVNASVTPRL